jgi:hypothetical protein
LLTDFTMLASDDALADERFGMPTSDEEPLGPSTEIEMLVAIGRGRVASRQTQTSKSAGVRQHEGAEAAMQARAGRHPKPTGLQRARGYGQQKFKAQLPVASGQDRRPIETVTGLFLIDPGLRKQFVAIPRNSRVAATRQELLDAAIRSLRNARQGWRPGEAGTALQSGEK